MTVDKDKGEKARYREDWTLATACEALHMGANGSSDPLPPHIVADLAEWLRWRLDNWTPSASKEDVPYDKAYRGLIRATIAELGRDPHGYPVAPSPDGLLADPVIVRLQDEIAAMKKARDEARADVIGFYLKQIGALSNARDEACDLVDALLVGKVGSQPNAMREQARALRKVGTHD